MLEEIILSEFEQLFPKKGNEEKYQVLSDIQRLEETKEDVQRFLQLIKHYQHFLKQKNNLQIWDIIIYYGLKYQVKTEEAQQFLKKALEEMKLEKQIRKQLYCNFKRMKKGNRQGLTMNVKIFMSVEKISEQRFILAEQYKREPHQKSENNGFLTTALEYVKTR